MLVHCTVVCNFKNTKDVLWHTYTCDQINSHVGFGSGFDLPIWLIWVEPTGRNSRQLIWVEPIQPEIHKNSSNLFIQTGIRDMWK